ncbi:ATP-binding cassette domain-containing protein [Sneathia vaginalis]|uniref:ATP-binding cassette domain-containing protein n=1 Tax=Sneathia vaginalis TaxID=187101 RepID=UPI0025515ED0|nr:ATP-binding cassette domain-containing protein [Sneathia vaginalis]MDK9582601.1 ATP-binding cassette domain-containing protein [Sneathia vaginalis]
MVHFFGIVSIYNNFLNSFLTLSGIVGRIKVGKSIFDKFDLEVLEETENRIKIDKINSISMENVSVANKLKPLTTSFQKSNKYSIVGESGSGKTTLIRTILGFEKYDGNILVNGINIKNIDMKNVYNEIDYVNDDKNILLGNIYENISLFKQYNKQKIDKILNLLNLTHLSTYDILSNDKLSTGEIARVKLARLIYDDKDILILDEALANIDVKNRDIINNYLSTTNKTIIEVTHHLDEKLKYNVIALK